MTHSAISSETEYYSARDAYRDSGLEHAAARTARNLISADEELSKRTPVLEVTYILRASELYAEHGDRYSKLVSTEPPNQREILLSVPAGFARDSSVRQMIVVSADDPSQQGIVGPRRSYVYIYTRDERDPSIIRLQAVEASPNIQELRAFLRALGADDTIVGKEGGRHLINATALSSETIITADRIVEAAKSVGGPGGYGEPIAAYFENRTAILGKIEEATARMKSDIIVEAQKGGDLEKGMERAITGVVDILNARIEGGQRRAVELFKEQYQHEPVLRELVTVTKPRALETINADLYSTTSGAGAGLNTEHAPRFAVVSVLGWGNLARWTELVVGPLSAQERTLSSPLLQVQPQQFQIAPQSHPQQLTAVGAQSQFALSGRAREIAERVSVTESPSPATMVHKGSARTLTSRREVYAEMIASQAARPKTAVQASRTVSVSYRPVSVTPEKSKRAALLPIRKMLARVASLRRTIRLSSERRKERVENRHRAIVVKNRDGAIFRKKRGTVSINNPRFSEKKPRPIFARATFVLRKNLEIALRRFQQLTSRMMKVPGTDLRVVSRNGERALVRYISEIVRNGLGPSLRLRTTGKPVLRLTAHRLLKPIDSKIAVGARPVQRLPLLLRLIRRFPFREQLNVERHVAVIEQKSRRARLEALLASLHPQRVLERLILRFKERQRMSSSHSDLDPAVAPMEMKKRRIKRRNRGAIWAGDSDVEETLVVTEEPKESKAPRTQKPEEPKPVPFTQVSEEPVWYLKTGVVRQSDNGKREELSDPETPANALLQ